MACSTFEMELTERVTNRPLLSEIMKKKQHLDLLIGHLKNAKSLAQFRQQLINGPSKQHQQEYKTQLQDWRERYTEASSQLFEKLQCMSKEKGKHNEKIEILMDKLMNQSKTELETKVMADEIRKMEGQIQALNKRRSLRANLTHSSPLRFKECGNNFRRFV